MAVESRLIEKVGEVGGKLHTARSRNDQVALDMRLFAKEAIASTLNQLKGLQRALIGLAEANKDVVMPGYTHLQSAQPVLLAHHLLAYFEMLQRDVARNWRTAATSHLQSEQAAAGDGEVLGEAGGDAVCPVADSSQAGGDVWLDEE